MKKIVAVLLLSSAGIAGAQDVPDSAVFAGIGGMLSAVSYQNQSLEAIGTSDVYDPAGNLISSGMAGGPPVNVNLNPATTIAPQLQLGYFQKFKDPEYLWGAKLNWSYNNTSSASGSFLVPQAGAFGTTPFTGNALVASYKSNLQQQFNLLLFVGKTFKSGFAYLGAGPTLSAISSSAVGVIGFADITGVRTDISGAPQSLAATSWVWGGQFSLGATYFVEKNWFIDLNYTFGFTANYSSAINGPFTNVTPTRTYVGMLWGTGAGNLLTNQVGLTINRAF